MEILGLAIGGFLALALTFIGLLMVTKLSFLGLGPAVRSVSGKKFGMIIGIILIIVSVGATVTYVKSAPWKGIGLGGTASLSDDGAVTSPAITSLSCVFNSAPSALTATYTTDTAVSGVSFVADPAVLNHYKAYVTHNNGTRSINGSVVCTRTGDINQAGAVKCYAKSSSFRNEVSTTDSNTYYFVATSASASKVAGFPWQQTIYLNSGAVATTASDREQTQLLYTGAGSAQVAQTLGFYVTLPGTTVWSYLNNQTSGDVKIYCNENEVADLTIVKVSA